MTAGDETPFTMEMNSPMKPRDATMLQFANQVSGGSSQQAPRGRPANLFAKRLSV